MEIETRKVFKDKDNDEPIETHLVRVYIDGDCRTVFSVLYDRELNNLWIRYNPGSINVQANPNRTKGEGG